VTFVFLQSLNRILCFPNLEQFETNFTVMLRAQLFDSYLIFVVVGATNLSFQV